MRGSHSRGFWYVGMLGLLYGSVASIWMAIEGAETVPWRALHGFLAALFVIGLIRAYGQRPR